MRLFFGLGLNGDVQAEIDRWRNQSLPPFARPVDEYSLHLRLAFLDEVSGPQLQTLFDLASLIRAQTFTLSLNQTGYWPKLCRFSV